MQKVNTGAGRGVGMDIVRAMVDKSGGTIEIQSEKGKYTLFKMPYPLNIAEPETLFAEEMLN